MWVDVFSIGDDCYLPPDIAHHLNVPTKSRAPRPPVAMRSSNSSRAWVPTPRKGLGISGKVMGGIHHCCFIVSCSMATGYGSLWQQNSHLTPSLLNTHLDTIFHMSSFALDSIHIMSNKIRLKNCNHPNVNKALIKFYVCPGIKCHSILNSSPSPIQLTVKYMWNVSIVVEAPPFFVNPSYTHSLVKVLYRIRSCN